MPGGRENRLHILLSDVEVRYLDELSEVTGFSKSDVVRNLIRQAHAERREEIAEIFGRSGPKKPRKR